MTLTTRLAIAMVLLVAIAVSAVGWLNYRSLEQALLPRVVDRLESQARLAAADLESYVAGARGDIAGFRSGVAVNGLMRARLGGGVSIRSMALPKKPGANGSPAVWRRNLKPNPLMRRFA